VSREERGGRITSGSEAANRRSRKRRSRLRLRNLRICNCVCRPDAERGRGDNTCQTDDPEFTHRDCPFVPCESALSSHRTHPRPVIAVTKWRKSPHPVPPTTTQSRSILHSTRAIRQPQSLVTAQLALSPRGARTSPPKITHVAPPRESRQGILRASAGSQRRGQGSPNKSPARWTGLGGSCLLP
jgi:hypothetical protein